MRNRLGEILFTSLFIYTKVFVYEALWHKWSKPLTQWSQLGVFRGRRKAFVLHMINDDVRKFAYDCRHSN